MKGFFPNCIECEYCKRDSLWISNCLYHKKKLPKDVFIICTTFEVKDKKYQHDGQFDKLKPYLTSKEHLYTYHPYLRKPEVCSSFADLKETD